MKNKALILLIIFLIIQSRFLFSQQSLTENIAIIEKQLDSVQGPARVDLLLDLITLYLPVSTDKAIRSAEIAMKYAEKEKTPPEKKAEIFHLLGQAYTKKNDYKKARDKYEEAIKIAEKTNDKSLLINIYYNSALNFRSLQKRRKSIENFESCLKIAREINSEKINEIDLRLYEEYYADKDYKTALEYYKLFMEKDFNQKLSILSYEHIRKEELIREALLLKNTELEKKKSEIKKMSTVLQYKDSALVIKELQIHNARLDSSLKATEINQLNFQNSLQAEKGKSLQLTIEKQRNVISFFIALVLVIFIFSILLFIQVKLKKRANNLLIKKNDEINLKNTELQQQKEEIEAQRDEIEQQRDILAKQNQHIRESIEYAKYIQTALLPPHEIINKLIPEHFILFQPKDIVSGDFYWMDEIDNKIIVVAADCTGHGVPGALMSMLGISFLHEIVLKLKVLVPSEILYHLRDNIKKTLRQTGKSGEAKDGMDISICVIDKVTKTIQYAGAYNPLYRIKYNKEKQINELEEIAADRMPIGIFIKEKESFTNHELSIQADEVFYMFSDGFCDQFGGDRGEKFKTRNFKQLLMEIFNLSLPEQGNKLKETIAKWQGNLDQLDDILVLGFRISDL